ncbi:MAG: hypothetical protein V4604_12190 [Bacteroidota bacterium]
MDSNETFWIKSKASKQFIIGQLVIFGALSIFLLIYQHYYLVLSLLIVNLLFAFRFYKQVGINNEQIIFYYPFRPFLKDKKIPVSRLKRFKFKPTHDGPEGWPYIRMTFSVFPYFTEFRITGMDDVYEIAKRLVVNGHFKVKASDYRKKQFFKYLETNKIDHHLKQ